MVFSQPYFGDAGTPTFRPEGNFFGDAADYVSSTYPFNQADNSSNSGLQNNLNNILGFLNSNEVQGTAQGIRSLFSSGDGNPYPGFDNELTEETVQRIGAETELRLNDLRNTLNDIAYLTGKSTPEFVSETDARYAGAQSRII